MSRQGISKLSLPLPTVKVYDLTLINRRPSPFFVLFQLSLPGSISLGALQTILGNGTTTALMHNVHHKGIFRAVNQDNHNQTTSTPTDNKTWGDRVTQLWTTLPLPSITTVKATRAQTTPTSSMASHVLTVGSRVTGDRHAQLSAVMPSCHPREPHLLVAPLPVSPVWLHPRTTHPQARVRMWRFDRLWARMRRVTPTLALFWILGRPIT